MPPASLIRIPFSHMLRGDGMGVITRNGCPIQRCDCLTGFGVGNRCVVPTPLPAATPVPTATSVPFLARQLDVKIDPKEAASYLLNPSPLGKGGYSQGMIVTIDILPKQGWQVDKWIGPVFNVNGTTAKIEMDSSQAVAVRLKLPTPPTATPVVTPPTSTSTPTDTPMPTYTPFPTEPPKPVSGMPSTK